MPSAGGPTTGPSVQYGVHTDQKRILPMSTSLDGFFFVVPLRDTSKKRMPNTGFNRQHP